MSKVHLSYFAYVYPHVTTSQDIARTPDRALCFFPDGTPRGHGCFISIAMDEF